MVKRNTMMFMRPYYVSGLIIALCLFVSINVRAQVTEENENVQSLKPSSETKKILGRLTTSKPNESNSQSTADIKEFRVAPIEGNLGAGTNAPKAPTNIPLLIPNAIILQLRPDLTTEEVQGLIEEKNLVVTDVYSNIGQIRAETDLSEYFKAELGDEPNESLLRGILESSKSFKSDPRILSASPDLLISTQSWNENYVENLANPDLVDLPSEETDWGIFDIKANMLWEKANADNPVFIGIMDVGFAEHEDLTFKDMSDDMVPNDHGNHVSGIACAAHNQKGVRGVLPVCWVKPEQGSFFPPDEVVDAVSSFMVQFSQILATLNNFVPESNEIDVYNLSLGYNWMPNFAINPDTDDNEIYRSLVQMQGEMFLAILEAADDEGKVIFSAAGNDSHGINPPIRSKYSSPFNWAALTAIERGIASNGVIVEAHDSDGKRASFSNSEGHLSCPGVGIT